jgi:hypothetical protein
VEPRDDRFGARVDVVQQRVPRLREIDDALRVSRFDVADEEADVGARDEGLSRARDHDALHLGSDAAI